jgi:hypothetical protein
MPEGATEKQRLEWHIEHARECGCRPFPARLMEKLSEPEKIGVQAGLAKGIR